MGTHISKVKSVDLDTWTDEQLQSVLKWGNARANKYWEAKLAPGHVPSEAKIENFIRTKYESKRWVMDGPMPDPSTLEADDDDVVSASRVTAQLREGRQLTTSAAPEEGPGEGADRALSVATPGTELWSGASPAETGPAPAPADDRPLRRRTHPSTTEYWPASSESAPEGRAPEAEQGGRFIARLRLSWRRVFRHTA
jgi:stromal membrane-associated protein